VTGGLLVFPATQRVRPLVFLACDETCQLLLIIGGSEEMDEPIFSINDNEFMKSC
jgi:hypothetical protein